MKKASFLLMCLFATSCLQYEEKYPSPPVCPSRAPEFLDEDPKLLSNLNVSPIYIEMRSGWQREENDYSTFHLYNNNGVYQTDIVISGAASAYRCRKDITPQQYSELTQTLNQSKMCEAIIYQQNSCSMAMFAPSSIFIVDPNGPTTVNLHPYNFEGKISFCDMKEVNFLEDQITEFYDDIDLESDCEVMTYEGA